ncbi:MAG: type I-E CRISPR-associated protein Cse2/CasB [Endozoicomonadaceae bacterium]|nr:type I-E CRISPR-associated protein Cse2/CasB [Endozoicomonadaceae bacterium]
MSIPDVMKIYKDYGQLKSGPKAELRRVAKPKDLTEISHFYRLLKGCKTSERMQRIVYCLPLINHKSDGDSLGQALAKANINEKRLIVIVRSESPNDLIQLRRLLSMTKPTLDWAKMATTLYWWNDLAKRKLLEDYFYYQNTEK